MDEILAEFLDEAEEALAAMVRAVEELASNPGDAAAVCYRSVHLLRGASGFLGLPRVSKLAAAGETLFSRLEAGAVNPAAGRIDAARQLHRSLTELVAAIRREGREPPGGDGAVIGRIEEALDGG